MRGLALSVIEGRKNLLREGSERNVSVDTQFGERGLQLRSLHTNGAPANAGSYSKTTIGFLPELLLRQYILEVDAIPQKCGSST